MDRSSDNAVGYLVSSYPAVSNTFIMREVRGLREAGATVSTYSIRRAPPEQVRSDVDLDEFDSTEFLLPVAAATLLWVHLRYLVRHPGAYLGTLAKALKWAPGGPRSVLWQAFYFAEAVLLFDSCRRRGLHRVHAHFANVASDVAWLAAELGRAVAPGDDWGWSFTMHGPTEFFATQRFNLRRKVEAAGTVLCISEFCRSQLMMLVDSEHWTKLHVAHCGVDPVLFSPRERVEEGDGACVVLSVGRLAPVKGQIVLVEAVAQLAARGLPVRLRLVGDGPSRERLEQLVSELGLGEAVEFLGAVGQDRLPDLFRQADVFCLPSFAEGVPVVLMEAMATAVPVVASPVGGIPELVDDGVSGILVPPGRADLLADALARLVASPELRRTLGAEGRKVVEAEFDIRECVTRVGELLGILDPQAKGQGT